MTTAPASAEILTQDEAGIALSAPRRGPSRGRWSTAGGLAPTLTALVLGLAAWQVVSIASDDWLPSVAQVCGGMKTVLSSDTLFSDFGTTLRRLLAVWLGAFAGGVFGGVLTGFNWRIRAFARPILAIALAIPDLVYIILAILILGPKESSSLIALVIAISPLVVNVVMNSALERDPRLDEMAKVYRLTGATYFFEVLWHQLRPALDAGARTSFAFSWKLIVLVEAITSETGVGAQIGNQFKYLRPAEMIAYALLFTLLMRIVEVLVLDRVFRPSKSVTR